jgi:protein SCO1
MQRNTWLSMAAVAALLVAALLAAAPAAADDPHWGANWFPNISLTTQDGKTVHFYDDLLKGKLVVIDLIYTTCKFSCPLETARMAQVQRLLGDHVGKEIFFYSISIDPEHDTPEVLKAYAEKFHAGPGWTFLTGKKEDIDLISKKLGLYSTPDINADGHTTYLMLGDVPHGQWMQNSAVDNPRFLATTIRNFFSLDQKQEVAKKSYSQAPAINIRSKGEYLFSTRCAACHTVGRGDSVGPDLLGVTNVRKHDWLTHFISTPDQLLEEKDPIATALFKKYNGIVMPNLRLGPDDVQYLIAFLQSEAAAADHAATVKTTGAKAGPGGR